jgi:hypothetical protein
LNTSVGRVEFARQLYNFLRALGEDKEEEGKDTWMKIDQLRRKIWEHDKLFYMKQYEPGKTRENLARTGASDDSSSVGSAGAADCEDLKSHGYQVKSQVTIVDNKGGTMEPLFKVWQPFCTHYMPC